MLAITGIAARQEQARLTTSCKPIVQSLISSFFLSREREKERQRVPEPELYPRRRQRQGTLETRGADCNLGGIEHDGCTSTSHDLQRNSGWEEEDDE